MDNINSLKELLMQPKKIVITSHLNPDGDAIGSSLALAEWLKNKGHSVRVIMPNEAPIFLRFPPGYRDIFFYTTNHKRCEELIREAEVLFAVDYNDMESRIGRLGDHISTLPKKRCVLIDHHIAPPEDMYEIIVSDSSCSSTALLVSSVIKQLGDWDKVTISMAQNLYLGIATDTGNFSFGNLTSDMYRTVADLVDKGVNTTQMNIRISQQQREERFRIMGYALAEKMIILPELRCGYLWLTAEELKRMNFVEGDIEGVVNYPLAIAGIENSAIFIEKPDVIKISLRSQGTRGIDMNRFAREHFIGGGHRNAAGGKWYGTMEETIDIFINGIQNIITKK